MNKKKKILFLGASITKGQISKSYVSILKKRLGIKQYEYINHGVAGFETFNVLNKLPKSIATNPDFVILLIGTNDVLSSLDPKLEKLSRKLKNIPHKATLHHFNKNISKIIRLLIKETNSKIAIASLPVVGENLDSIENKTLSKYNTEIKKNAEVENINYLPVFEKQSDFLLNAIGGKGKNYIKGSKMIYQSLFLHYMLFMKLDTISRRNGYLLLIDGIHQNSKGAKFIASNIEDFIKKYDNN